MKKYINVIDCNKTAAMGDYRQQTPVSEFKIQDRSMYPSFHKV